MPAHVQTRYADDEVMVQLRTDVPRALKLALGDLAEVRGTRLIDQVRLALITYVASQGARREAILALGELNEHLSPQRARNG